MALTIGEVLEGTVTGITKFGCFVSLEEGRSGLVHISEVANTYVSDVNDHVHMGDKVKVKVLNITDDGKINLSIKKAMYPPARPAFRPVEPRAKESSAAAPMPRANSDSCDQDFEDRLKRFMQESDSRIAGNRLYSDRKQRGSRRR